MEYNYEPYKRNCHFTQSPFRYPGGKFYALKYIMPFIECVPHNEFREPFVGGGSVFFAKAKAEHNWINDLNSKIIDFYNFILTDDNRNGLLNLFTDEKVVKERHAEVKQMVPKNKLDEVFQTYFLNRTSYSGIINAPAWGYADGKSSPPQNWGKFINGAAEKLQETLITNLDFEEVIRASSKHDKVLMYLDPPYYHADQKRAYEKAFTADDHIRLAAALKDTEFLFCLSYDDCAEIRELYRWANIYGASWLYNTKNCKGATRKKGQELIITNYTVTKFDLFNFSTNY